MCLVVLRVPVLGLEAVPVLQTCLRLSLWPACGSCFVEAALTQQSLAGRALNTCSSLVVCLWFLARGCDRSSSEFVDVFSLVLPLGTA